MRNSDRWFNFRIHLNINRCCEIRKPKSSNKLSFNNSSDRRSRSRNCYSFNNSNSSNSSRCSSYNYNEQAPSINLGNCFTSMSKFGIFKFRHRLHFLTHF